MFLQKLAINLLHIPKHHFSSNPLEMYYNLYDRNHHYDRDDWGWYRRFLDVKDVKSFLSECTKAYRSHSLAALESCIQPHHNHLTGAWASYQLYGAISILRKFIGSQPSWSASSRIVQFSWSVHNQSFLHRPKKSCLTSVTVLLILLPEQ